MDTTGRRAAPQGSKGISRKGAKAQRENAKAEIALQGAGIARCGEELEMSGGHHIETVTRATFEAVLPLIAEYQRFYRAQPDAARNREHFSQFLEDHRRGILFIARDAKAKVLGFATLYFFLSSVQARTQCILNDLYTVPEVRGQGIGRALIEHCRRHARQLGFDQLTWQTERSNETAQRLYDRLGAERSEWLTYSLPVLARDEQR